MPINLPAANSKLLQAELLCAHLRVLPGEIALSMRPRAGGDYRLPLEAFFSASLNAARSCFFILARTGGPPFKYVASQWKRTALDEQGRARFNFMLALRDRDVHFGEMDAETLPKMMELDMRHTGAYVQHNAALHGWSATAEHTNPDGTTVRASALQGTVGLYIEIGGSMVEATTACIEFIGQLRSLLQAAEVAEAARSATASGAEQPPAEMR